MKKVIAMAVVILSIVGVYRFFQNPGPVSRPARQPQSVREIPLPEPSTTTLAGKKQRVLFVPYWNAAVDEETKKEYDTFVYFGVAVDENGTIKQDEGYSSISPFQRSTVGTKQLLTLRMLDTNTNHSILEDSAKQEKIIEELVPLLSQYDFDGLVLDLEVSSLPLTDVSNNISLFIERIGQTMAAEDKHFAVTIYGDVYYRARPYDMKTIGAAVDEVMIMAYDFHKSRGEPGPNFPKIGRETYGYDFEAMTADFIQDVSPEKLTVLMGMYGYDWTLGPQGKPLKAARALPLADIYDIIDPSCDLTSCKVTTNPETKETKITYRDDDGYAHELWFENEDSAAVKHEYLEEKGIWSVGYWVYGYW